MRMTANQVLIFLALTLTGCGDGMSGVYVDEAGVTQYAFSGKGSVKILVLGAEVDAEYRVDDDKVLVSSAQGTVVLSRRNDRLYGPMGLELIRQANNPEGD